MKDYVSIKLCPICGEAPERFTTDLGRPGGHGYPGHAQYYYKCDCCSLMEGKPCDDVYNSRETALRRAKECWNEEVNRVQEYLDRIYVKRKDIF
jgi:hypothetical protein